MTTYTVPHTFIPGTKAKANEVNENFAVVLDHISNTKLSSADLSLSNLTQAGKDVIYYNSVPTHLIGEIVSSPLKLTDGGLHLLDGALLSGDGIYAEFVEYMSSMVDSHSSLFCDEATWQSTVSSKSTCGKFVYNQANNTIRLPKISDATTVSSDMANVYSLYYIVVANGTKKELDIQVDNIATELNGKADIDLSNTSLVRIKETYTNGKSGYMVYSNNFCKQWGWIGSASANAHTTITLLKKYKDTNYSVLLTYNTTSTAVAGGTQVGVAKMTASNFAIGCQGGSIAWRAYGYIA